MSRWGQLSMLVRVGCLMMMLGNGLMASLKYKDSAWKYLVYLVPANIGQGISYPAILFTNLAAFDHSRKCQARFRFAPNLTLIIRPSRLDVHGLSFPFVRHRLGCGSLIDHNTKYPGRAITAGAGWDPRERKGEQTLSFLSLVLTEQIIDEIRHSVSVLKNLPPEVESIARHVYFDALRQAFLATTVVGAVALISAFFARGRDLNRG